jgi:hypothetical protein
MYCGLRFSARSIVGTIDLYNIGVSAIFYKLLEKMFLKEFRKPREYNSYWTDGPGCIYQTDLFSIGGILNMLLFENLEKKEQFILVKAHGYLPV